MPRIFALLFLALAARGGLHADEAWFDPAYLEASSENGGTGFILNPSGEIIPGGTLFASIHRYQVKLGYGLWERLELGLTADLEGYHFQEDVVRNQLFMARLRLLSGDKYGIGLSVGADGVGLEDLGGRSLGFLPKASLETLDRVYVVAGGLIPFYPALMLSAGWGGGSRPSQAFFSAAWVALPGLLALAEYDGEGTNLGARLLLSPRVKLDLAFLHTQEVDPNQPFSVVLQRNVRFGITYSEPWPPRKESKPHAP